MSILKNKWARNTIAGLSALVLANTTIYTLHQSEQGVVTTFGKASKVLLNPIETVKYERDSVMNVLTTEISDYVKKENDLNKTNEPMPRIDEHGAGIKLKAPWQKVHRYDRRLMEWDGAPEQIPTKDKKYLFVDGTARWLIRNPYVYFRALGGNETQALGKLDDVIDGVEREQISQRNAIESIRSSNRKMLVADKELEQSVQVDSIYDGREKLAQKIHTQANAQCYIFGIGVKDFLIKRLVYEESVKKGVEDRMISERERISNNLLSEGNGDSLRIMGEKDRDLLRIKSGAYMNAEQIRGRGDAQATKIYNEAYSIDPEFYAFYKSLEVMKDKVKGATLVMDKNNQLFQYVNGKK
jgi:membrane protease subunit HflC